MNKPTGLLTALLIACALPASAAQLRLFVSDVNAVGVPNRDEMKATIQTLLASRLSGDKALAVGSAAEADAVVSGTYVSVGKIFSIDAIVKSAGGKTLTRAFVQGESQDELIPAVGKLAEKLTAELDKVYTARPGVSAPIEPAVQALPAGVAAKSEFVRPDKTVTTVAASEFIKPPEFQQGTRGGWVSKRLDGSANLMAQGRLLADGSREVFLAEDRYLTAYRQSSEMKPIAALELRVNEKIISLDAAEEGNDTVVYLTVLRGDDLASQVLRLQGDKLVKLAGDLPYYFRTMNLAGGPKKIYAQSAGRDSDFFGDVYEATLNGAAVTLKNPIAMPRYGTIYTFNQFRDKENKLLTVVINPDNYLVVYDQSQTELWRSNDKFGGSELFYQKEDLTNQRATGEKYRWAFMNQRIQVTAKGDVLVGKNDGFWVLGNSRSFKRGAVFCFAWNGSSLEELWHTRDTQNYMPDYHYDENRNELLILQTVQRPGITSRGASSLSIRKVE